MVKKATQLVFEYRFFSAVAVSLVLFFAASVFVVVSGGRHVGPTDSHVVLLYSDGVQSSVPTRAKNVAEFLQKNNIALNQNDLVEPSDDTAIESDDFRINIARARSFVVVDQGKKLASISSYTSPRLVAEQAGLSLHPADMVRFVESTNPFDDELLGRRVEVIRAKKVALKLYGTATEARTNASTYGEFLKEIGVSPSPDDELTQQLSSFIAQTGSLEINKKDIRTISEEIVVPQGTDYVDDAALNYGATAVRDPGAAGKKVITYEIRLENDIEVGRTEISSALLEQPRNKIVARGKAVANIAGDKQALMALAGIDPSEYAAMDYIIGQESGWCATKWQGSYGYCPAFYEEKYLGAEKNTSLGYGLCQSTPAIKMASIGEDWRTNAVAQLVWCANYARDYGSISAAAEFKRCLGSCYSTRTRNTQNKVTTWF